MTKYEAYFDDSTANTGDKRLFFAGYVNTSVDWRHFCKAWQECLDASPSVEYFKMSEAVALRGQFHGWRSSERDAKIRRLSFIVAHFCPTAFSISVSKLSYEKIARAGPHALASPHFICIFGAISGVSRHFARTRTQPTSISFFFDQQPGVDMNMKLFFDYMKKNIPSKAQALIAAPPEFVDDFHYTPIQAADMLAWFVRRQHEFGDADDDTYARMLGAEYVKTEIKDELVEKIASSLSEIPGASLNKGKYKWQTQRDHLMALKAEGFIPPYGTHTRNRVFGFRDWIKHLLRARR